METKVVFEEKVSISPNELNKVKNSSIDDLLLKKFANAHEGQCSVHGWLIPGSLKILSRSVLQIEGGRFTGDLVSWVQVEGSVIYPVDGVRLKGLVLKKNKMGLFVMYENAIQVMVPRDLHIGNEEFDSVQINDMVEVEIKKSRFQVKDQYILSVGLFIAKAAKPVMPINMTESSDMASVEDQSQEEEDQGMEEEADQSEATDLQEEEEEADQDQDQDQDEVDIDELLSMR